MKTYYRMKIALEIEVDPKNPQTLAKAAEWMNKVAEGKITPPHEGLPLNIEVISAPDIVKQRDASK
jgi:hypothetical protein